METALDRPIKSDDDNILSSVIVRLDRTIQSGLTWMSYAYVYIMASQRNGTLYIGVTRELGARIQQHKTNYEPKSFTARYGVHTLVHVEGFDLIADAISYEKRLKGWNRDWKLALIEKTNPRWLDIDPGSFEFIEPRSGSSDQVG